MVVSITFRKCVALNVEVAVIVVLSVIPREPVPAGTLTVTVITRDWPGLSSTDAGAVTVAHPVELAHASE